MEVFRPAAGESFSFLLRRIQVIGLLNCLRRVVFHKVHTPLIKCIVDLKYHGGQIMMGIIQIPK